MSSNLTSMLYNVATKNKKGFTLKSTKSEKLFKSRNMYSDFNYNYDYNLWEKDQYNKSFDYPQIETLSQQRQQENEAATPSRIYGLLPIEYDGGFVNDNSSSILGDFYGSENETLTTNENQFSTPIMYIICMMAIYGFIILVVCIYALYSHRKRIGYNYDENLDGYSSSEEMDESICERSHYLYRSLNTNESGEKTVQIDTNYINAIESKADKEIMISTKNDNSAFENSLSDEGTGDDESDEKDFICIEMKVCKNSYEKLATNDEQEEDHFNQNLSRPLQSLNYLDKLFQYIPIKNNNSRLISNQKPIKSKKNQKYSNMLKNSFSVSMLSNKRSDISIVDQHKISNSPLILDVEKIYVENKL